MKIWQTIRISCYWTRLLTTLNEYPVFGFPQTELPLSFRRSRNNLIDLFPPRHFSINSSQTYQSRYPQISRLWETRERHVCAISCLMCQMSRRGALERNGATFYLNFVHFPTQRYDGVLYPTPGGGTWVSSYRLIGVKLISRRASPPPNGLLRKKSENNARPTGILFHPLRTITGKNSVTRLATMADGWMGGIRSIGIPWKVHAVN